MNLRPAAGAPGSRWREQPFAVVALGLGIASVVAAAAMLLSSETVIWDGGANVDLRWILPPAVATGALAAISLLRREKTLAIPLTALGLAAAALVLGWIVVVGLVALGAALLIGILSLVL